MDIVYVALGFVVLIVAAAAVFNNLDKKQYAAAITALRADVAKIPGVGAQLSTIDTRPLVAPTAPPGAIPGAVTVTIHPVTITNTAPPASPAGTITAAPAGPERFNGIAVPAGMTLASFTALGVAKQGVMSFLASASVVASLVTETDAWFGALGAYFVEQLSVLAPAGSPLAARVATYVAAHPVEVVTPAQEAAAFAAVNAVAPKQA